MATWPRIWLLPAVVASSLTAIVLVSGDHGSLVRNLFVLVFLTFAPGITIVTAVDLRLGWASAISLAVAVSLAVDGFVAGIGLFVGVWEPRLFVYFLAGLSLLAVGTALFGRTSQRVRIRRQSQDERHEWKSLESISRDDDRDDNRVATELAAALVPRETLDRGGESGHKRRRLGDVTEGRNMTDRPIERELTLLRDQARNLEEQVAAYRELVERLQLELDTYRKREELWRTSLAGSRARAESAEAESTPESETVLQHAEARLNAALERLRTSSERRGSMPPREGP